MGKFIPTTGEAALAQTMQLAKEKEVAPEDVACYFEEELPEGARVRTRTFAQIGLVITVEVDGESTNYDLTHGDEKFPKGKAEVRD